MRIDYRKELNREQFEVVTKADGPCLVLAGAGSGKTRTLVYRVAYLIEQNICPDNIMLVTFTNKAAREMLERVKKLVGVEPERLWGGTFHRLGNLTLRKYADRLGYKRNFNILDQDDSETMVKDLMAELGYDSKKTGYPSAKVIHSIISFTCNTGDELREVLLNRYGYPEFLVPVVDRIADAYREKKLSNNVMDFDDLLFNWLELLKRFREIKESLGGQYQYILVDEYQDTNYLQADIIRHLSESHNNVLAVGDDSQSIYSFRAAEVKNILNFPKEYGQARTFYLTENYRSTPQILSLANDSIKHNREQFEKTLISRKQDGMMPAVVLGRDVYHQAKMIVSRVKELMASRVKLSEMAVLFRAAFHSAELQLELSKENIPYVVRGGQRYFEQSHIKDILAFLKVTNNIQDELAWKRLFKMQPRIGEITALRIWKKIQSCESLSELLGKDLELQKDAKNAWFRVSKMLTYLKKIKEQAEDHFISAMVEFILEHGYESYLRDKFDNSRERIEDLEQFVNFVSQYDSIEKLLSDVALSENFRGENVNYDNALVLSTIHQAKGLEWDQVMIIGLREGFFPHPKSMKNQRELEEERRLFYVAVTRAKKELYMFYPVMVYSYNSGNLPGRASLFVQELNEEAYVQVNSSDSMSVYDDFHEDSVISYD